MGKIPHLDIEFGFVKRKWIKKRKIKDILKYPPGNNEQLVFTILEYLKSEYFRPPQTFYLLKNTILKANKNFINTKKHIENLDFLQVLKYLQSLDAIKLCHESVGVRLEYVI